MTEQNRESIAEAGRYCELELRMADAYDKNGNLREAARHFERAESESDFAFQVASWS